MQDASANGSSWSAADVSTQAKQGGNALLGQVEQLQEQLHQVTDALAESHRLTTLGTLTAVVAHEYNNLLTPIISYAQMALANPADQQLQQKALHRALDAAQQAAEVSSSILGFASGHAHANTAPLRQVVEQSLACLARAPAKDGIDLDLRLIDVTLAMPSVALQQVLVNLMVNARKAMRQNGGKLSLHAQRQGDFAILTVADTGPGIPEQVQEQLFEPFVTCPITPKQATTPPHAEKPQGTGLGLAICRQLLQHAGGSIRLDTPRPPQQGARFVLTIPIA